MKSDDIKIRNFKEKSTFNKIDDIPLYELFHRNSEINSLNAYNFSKGILRAISDKEFINECFNHKCLHEDKEVIKLPDPNSKLTTLNLFDVIFKRRSVRSFSNEPMTFEELSTILFYSSGMTGKYDKTDDKTYKCLFAYPSAGALMPLDSYILINNVKDINPGIYYYDPIKHVLKFIKGIEWNELPKITFSYNLSKQAAFVIYILGSMRLTGYKYGDRGYRFMLLEAGHLAQNIYLTSTGIGGGAVASGGFLDVEVLELLDLNDKDMFVLYEMIIGKPDLNIDYRFVSKK
ncbi:SagB/ThcOx family dehydrogenase [Clostridium algidicarnis]|uniref:SagB/ThcOx family dehydrogenase n=1 Tax=Clostridium algidicarnis TaxID=37659 RepID=UPI001C0D8A26|nr:SagB/ThcOx family dehydrogenase [Clostridium algidicarnis]MBU3228917.1 SagB/ThcOx family dehydrogenase [Clostridium algidicarnis]MBU3252461.1 SagB/ThcOx family dehydrogenase [Clostridium algidicarnis]